MVDVHSRLDASAAVVIVVPSLSAVVYFGNTRSWSLWHSTLSETLAVDLARYRWYSGGGSYPAGLSTECINMLIPGVLER
jgi:hypothetical protein